MNSKLTIVKNNHLFLYQENKHYPDDINCYLCTCWQNSQCACQHYPLLPMKKTEIASFSFPWFRNMQARFDEMANALKLLKDEILDDVKSNNNKLSNKMLFKLITMLWSCDGTNKNL